MPGGPEWRNRHTQRSQKPPASGPCGFESHLRHVMLDRAPTAATGGPELDSACGGGWKRDNSFLTHRAKGSFCYGLFPHGSHPAGSGKKYRATAEGPGVTPDVMWQGEAP